MASRLREEPLISLLRSVYTNGRHSSLSRCRTRSSRARQLGLIKPVRQFRSSAAGRAGLLFSYSNEPRAETSTGREQRRFASKASQAKPAKREIAILGGGITGLTTAHYLARHAKDAKITLYEASDRLGGWIDGIPVKIDDAGNTVLLQRGARTVRSGSSSLKYDDLVLYDVIASLGLQDEIRFPSPAAESRYIYYPDHLVKLPGTTMTIPNIMSTLSAFITEPLWRGVWEVVSAMMQRGLFYRRPPPPDDESVGDYISRKYGSRLLVDRLFSAMMHGIYGGDVWKLSVKQTIFDAAWQRDRYPLPQRSRHAQLQNVLLHEKELSLMADMAVGPNDIEVMRLGEMGTSASMWALNGGLGTLVDALEKDLEGCANVEIRKGTTVKRLEHDQGRVVVTTDEQGSRKHDHVISTLFSRHLSEIAPPDSLPSLASTKAVTIAVVNMWYPDSTLLAANPGFGYLIPSAVPFTQNPEGALGVLFDSDVDPSAAVEVPGTKLTVMLGGHHWEGAARFPTEAEAIDAAERVLERHLQIPPQNEGLGGVAMAKICHDCIPQQTVGHRERMAAAHHELQAAFNGRLSVAGPSYTNVGVVPAMRAGYDIAMRVATGRGGPYFKDLWKAEREEELKSLGRGMGSTGAAVEAPVGIDWDGMFPSGVSDHVGATGLAGFAKPERGQLLPCLKGSMLFKKWSMVRPTKRMGDIPLLGRGLPAIGGPGEQMAAKQKR